MEQQRAHLAMHCSDQSINPDKRALNRQFKKMENLLGKHKITYMYVLCRYISVEL